MSETTEGGTDTTYWENRYATSDRVWSGRPNELLVREVADLPAGRALELGCGEGADSIWLARRGWHVTGVEVAATALRRAAEHAEQEGVAGRTRWVQADLTTTALPAGPYDLVCAQYFHSPAAAAGSREDVLRRAAAEVAPGGRLLVVGHAGWASWLAEEDRPDVHLPTTADVLAALAVAATWVVETDDLVERESTSPDGVPGTRADNVLLLRRST